MSSRVAATSSVWSLGQEAATEILLVMMMGVVWAGCTGLLGGGGP